VERALSKTQLEAWKLCKRKWGFPYLEGLRGSNEFATFGTQVHAQLERWLARGVLPDPYLPEGKVAESGLQHLPPPSTPGLLVETEVFTITNESVYHGFADWIEPPVDGVPVIGDHKSTVDFKWSLTPEDLEQDIQANIYARAAMQLYDVDRAEARWIYYRTRGAPKSHVVSRSLTREGVERVFLEVIDPLAAEIQAAWEQRPRVLELEPNPRACNDFGGCPFRESCSMDAKGRLIAMVAHSGLAAQMKAKAEAKKAAEAQASTTTPKAAEAQASTTTPKVAEAEAPTGGINPPEGQASKVPLKDRLKSLSKAAKGETPATPAPETPKATEDPPEVKIGDFWAHGSDKKPSQVVAIGPGDQVALNDGTSSVTTSTKFLRNPTTGWRFVRSGGAPEASSEPTQAKAAPEKPKATKTAPEPAASTGSGFTLLYGCFPTQGPGVTHATDYIGRAKHMIESELGLQDYRLAEFGKGAGLLAAATRQCIADDPPDGLVFLDSRTDEGRHTFEAFRESASIVIRSL
jgi:hypothetical protein